MKLVNDESLRTEAAAEYLSDKVGYRVTPNLLQGWRGRRMGPRWFKLGGVVLYPRAGLDSFITQSTQAA